MIYYKEILNLEDDPADDEKLGKVRYTGFTRTNIIRMGGWLLDELDYMRELIAKRYCGGQENDSEEGSNTCCNRILAKNRVVPPGNSTELVLEIIHENMVSGWKGQPQISQEKPPAVEEELEAYQAEQQDPKQPKLPRDSNNSASDDKGSDYPEYHNVDRITATLRHFFIAGAEDEKTHKSFEDKEDSTAEEPKESIFNLELLSYL